MRNSASVLALLVLGGCGGASAEAETTALPSMEARGCDHAMQSATAEWRSRAADLRVEAIRAWVDGTLDYRAATASLLSSDVGDGALARAKRLAVREAAGTSARAADRADLTLDDAIEASASHTELRRRFEALESSARAAWEEARDAHDTALRNVDNGSAVLTAAAVTAPDRARQARERAAQAERRAAMTCDLPVAQYARRF
jgi:hypothetical protein